MAAFDLQATCGHPADVVTGEHVVRGAEPDRADLVEACPLDGGEADLQGAQIVLQPGESGGAGDRFTRPCSNIAPTSQSRAHGMRWLWFTARVSRPSGVATPSGEVKTVTTSSPAPRSG
ncbi:hypothetical protein Stube_05650 [Streptomyces tubercidicus]|uniref:Uncharacterized protein n=1 Tax=Streptomyces tubercidicus TaxID=47759 RepID=A0A640UKL5_9ACTN|nr:hypothetical protein Stube_05650 [Streptomyces tubercidicus]